METKFTKGPWAANVWTCGRRSVYKALRTGNRGTPEIAEIWPTHDDDEHRANANLIAAAPEMYEKGAFKRNVIIHDRLDFVGEWIAVPREDFEAFQAERAKARGET